MRPDLFQSDSPAGADFYARIAPIYDPLAGPFLRPVRRVINATVRDCGCGRILDIGCGTGEQVEMLASSKLPVVGIDLSPSMLSKARERLKKNQLRQAPQLESRSMKEGQAFHYSPLHRISFIQGSGQDLPFPSASFDCALISLALHEMDYSSAIRVTGEALRVLTPGGKLILFDYFSPYGFTSKISLALLHIVERLAGKTHFINFKYFVKNGGLGGFVRQFPLRLICSRRFFGGAIGLVVCGKQL